MNDSFKKWYDERPKNEYGVYRFKTGYKNILGMQLMPEWTEEMHCCGMGHGNPEWWPLFSYWDGWNRTVPDDLEWRELEENESKKDKNLIYHGLNLLNCPFTGKQPKIDYHGRSPYYVDWLSIKSHLVDSYGWRDAKEMENVWNKRS